MTPPSERLRFAQPTRPRRAADLDDVARAQLVALGEAYDGERLSAAERLESDSPLYEPERWALVDGAGRACFDAWFYGVDSGAVFRADTVELIGLVLQFGFTCSDLAAWERIAQADRSAGDADGAPFAMRVVDFSLDDEGGPLIRCVPPALYDALAADPARARDRFDEAEVRVAGAWRALRVAVHPWDPDAALTRLLTASSPRTIPGLRSVYGTPPAYFSAADVIAIAAAFEALPADAVERRAEALAAQIGHPDDREPARLAGLLAALAGLARRAAREGAGLLVSVS